MQFLFCSIVDKHLKELIFATFMDKKPTNFEQKNLKVCITKMFGYLLMVYVENLKEWG
jgi:hypothetical protein